MAEQYKVLFEAGIDPKSFNNIKESLAKLSKEKIVLTSDGIDSKSIEKAVKLAMKNASKQSKIKIGTEVDTTVIDNVKKSITDLESRQVKINISQFERQFHDILKQSNLIKDEFSAYKELADSISLDGNKDDLKELNMMLKELKENARTINFKETLKPIEEIDLTKVSTEHNKLLTQYKEEIKFSSELKAKLAELDKARNNLTVGGSIDSLNQFKTQLKEVDALAKNIKVSPKFIEDQARQKGELKLIQESIKEMERLEKQVKKFNDIKRPKLFMDVQKVFDNNKNLITSNEELLDSFKKLTKDISLVDPTDVLAVSELTNSVKEFERTVKDVNTAVQKSKEFDIGKRGDMVRKLDELQTKYQEVIQTNKEFADEFDRLGQVASSVKFDDKLGIAQYNADVKDLTKSLKETKQEMEQIPQTVNKSNDAFARGISSLSGYVAQLLSLRMILRQAKEGFAYIKEIDSSLTEIGMVTNKTVGEVKAWGDEYLATAEKMKVSNKSMTAGAVGFVRQGLSQAEVLERLTTTTRFAKITNTDFKESVELLTATVNGMNVDIERASDVMIHLGDSTATSGQEIAKGLSKTAGSASALGVEFEKVASWIAVISAKTREAPESIGSAINMILSRMGRITEKGFDEEDGTQINDVAKALNRAGVMLQDETTGQFRDFGLVLDELGERWESLDRNTQIYIANAVAGARRQSSFLQLMSGYAESIELYNGALEASGTSAQKYEIYLDSLQAKLDGLKVAFEKFYETLMNASDFGMMIEALTELLNIITALTEQFGVLGLTIGALSTKAGISMMLKSLTTGIGSVGFSLAALNPKVLAIGALLTVAPVVIGKVVDKLKDFKEEVASTQDILSMDNLADLSHLNAEYKSLTKNVKDAQKVNEESIRIGRELAKMYPELADGVDKNGQAYVKNLSVLDDLIKKEMELKQVQAQSKIEQNTGDIEEYSKRAELIREEIQIHERNIKVQEKVIETNKGVAKSLAERSKNKSLAQLKELNKEYQEVSNAVTQLADANEMLSNVQEESTETIKNVTAELAYQEYQADKSAENLEKYIAVLVDVGYTAEEASVLLEHGIQAVTEAVGYGTQANYEHITSLNTMTQAEKAHAQSMISIESEMLRAKKEATLGRIAMMESELKVLQTLSGQTLSITKSLGFDMGKERKSIYDNVPGLPGITTSPLAESLNKKQQETKNELYKSKVGLSVIEKELKNLKSMSDHINSNIKVVSETGGSGGSGAGTKSANKQAQAYRAVADVLAEINSLLEKNSNALSFNKAKQGALTDDIKQQISLKQDEIILEKQKQGLMHTKAQLLRQERDQLSKTLQAQGFVFEGTGDSKAIANLEHINGKSKETEEIYKRFIEIQQKAIPELQTGWWTVQQTINQLNMDNFKLHVNTIKKDITELDDELKRVQHSINMVATVDETGVSRTSYDIGLDKIQSLNQGIEIHRAKLEVLTGQYEALKSMGLDPIIGATQEYQEEMKSMESAIMSAEEVLHKATEGYLKQIETIRKGWISEQNKIFQAQRQRLAQVDKVQEEIVKIIKKRGEEEKKALQESHKKELDLLKDKQKAYDDSYKKDLDAYKKLIEDKLRLLNEQYEEEEYADSLGKEQEELNKLNRELIELSLDDTLEARAREFKLKKQIEEQEYKIQKMQRDKSKKEQEKLLKDKLKDYEDEKKAEKEIAKDSFEYEKQSLEDKHKMELELLESAYDNASVYAEARKALIDGQVEYTKGSFISIEDAFERFSRDFGKGMGILGDVIQHDFIAQLDEAVKAIERMEYATKNLKIKYSDDFDVFGEGKLNKPSPPSQGSSSKHKQVRPPEFHNWSESDFAKYLLNKRAWNMGSEDEKSKRAEENSDMRAKYWGEDKRFKDEYSYEDLMKMIARYEHGGFIPKTGLVMAHEREMYVPDKYQRDLWEFIKNPLKIQGSSMPNIVNSLMGNDIKFVFEVHGNLDKTVLPDIEELFDKKIKEYNKDRGDKLIANGYKIGGI